MTGVIAITGASSGIGRATARLYAQEGASLVLLARDHEALDETAAELRKVGGTITTLSCDISDWASVSGAVDRIEREIGPIEVWINAGVASGYGTVDQTRPEDYKRVIEVALLGAIYGAKAVLAHMKQRDRGSIILVGSALSYRGYPLQSAYSAAKFGLRGFQDAVRAELASEGSKVRLQLVAPGAIDTPFYRSAFSRLANRPKPPAPVYSVETVAEAIRFAHASGRREVAAGGTAALARQTQNLAPGLTDMILGKFAIPAQISDEPNDPSDQGALEAASRVHDEHGGYGGRASSHLWLTKNRSSVLVGVAALVLSVVVGRRRGR